MLLPELCLVHVLNQTRGNEMENIVSKVPIFSHSRQIHHRHVTRAHTFYFAWLDSIMNSCLSCDKNTDNVFRSNSIVYEWQDGSFIAKFYMLR